MFSENTPTGPKYKMGWSTEVAWWSKRPNFLRFYYKKLRKNDDDYCY